MTAYVPIETKRQVIERAGGCCEYCLIAADDEFLSHEIDHIVATRHRGNKELANLAYSCAHCNRHKGSDLSSIDLDTMSIVQLFDPRQMRWGDHFRLVDASIVLLTAIGRVTEFLLQFNTSSRVSQRETLMRAGTYPCSPLSF